MTSGKRIELIGIFHLLVFVGGPVRGQMVFSDHTEKAGIDHHYLSVNEIGGGAAFFDMDNDGDEDLWLSGGLNWDKLYENNGSGIFTDISWEAGLPVTKNYVTTGVITGDLNNDGFKDVLLLTHTGFPNILLKNNGNKTFSNITQSSGLGAFEAYNVSAAMGDVNGDGYLDIYVANYIERPALMYNAARDTVLGFQHQCHSNRLFINNGDLSFSEKTAAYRADDTGCALAAAFTDFDADNDADILVSNDFGAWIAPNALLQNQYPEPTFQNASQNTGTATEIYGMGIAMADVDNDLDTDYYLTNIGSNVLLQNQGNGQFTDLAKEAGISDTYQADSLFSVGWGTIFADFDLDTDPDLYVVNGYIPAAPFIANGKSNSNRLFENDGRGHFSQVALSPAIQSPERGRGLTCADIDGDGDLDCLVVNVNRQATSDTIQKVQLFRNELPAGKHWIAIALKSYSHNIDGIGSKVVISLNGRKYMQEVHGGYGTHASQHSSLAHFGLGAAEKIDSILVIWPDGKKQSLANIPVNQKITITENEQEFTPATSPMPPSFFQLQAFPNPFSKEVQINYELKEKDWVQLNVFDQLGRRLFSRREEIPAHQVGMLSWQAPGPGTYFVQLANSKHSTWLKLISR